LFDGVWAVIEARQNVAMHVHHMGRELLSRTEHKDMRTQGVAPELNAIGCVRNAGCALTCRLERSARAYYLAPTWQAIATGVP
jgi:hypothetical protein